MTRHLALALLGLLAAACGPDIDFTGDPSIDACLLVRDCVGVPEELNETPLEYCEKRDVSNGLSACNEVADEEGECILEHGRCEQTASGPNFTVDVECDEVRARSLDCFVFAEPDDPGDQ